MRSKLTRRRAGRDAARRRNRRGKFARNVENLEPRQLLAADPVISEFVAFNTAVLQDEDGAYSDWVEIQNRGDTVADLSGYFLSDDSSDLDKWRIPTGTSLEPGEATVVFASGKDRDGAELHTNFTLDELGGDILMTAPNGSDIVSSFTDYPAVGVNQAYGSYQAIPDGPYVVGVLNVPTPGKDNSDVSPVITEFMADNNNALLDEDGDTSDWVELHNPGVAPIDLSGWYLSDDPTLQDRWTIPKVTLEADGYLVVFASGKDRNDPAAELHTNFRLSAGGDYIALVEPDGETISSEYGIGGVEYTNQFGDVSFGIRGREMFEVGANDPVKGLVAYWDFEEGTGTTLFDVSGNGVNGTIRNMETGDWVEGHAPGTMALAFDGVDEFIETGATASDLDMPGKTPRTMMGWARGPAFFKGKIGNIFEMGSSENDFKFIATSILGTTYGLEYGEERVSTTVSAEEWFHFATAFDGDTVRLYLNGNLVREGDATDLFTDDLVPFSIGGSEDSSNFKGEIDELAVWDMSLDSDTIAQIVDGSLDPLDVRTVSRPIGVDRNAFTVRQVLSTGQVTNLAQANALLTAPAGDPSIAREATARRETVNMFDLAGGGSNGQFRNDATFPADDESTDEDNFATHVTATLLVPDESAGDFMFAVTASDGVRFEIDGTEVILGDSTQNATTLTGSIVLSAGEHSLDLVHFERTGEASLELAYASVRDDGVQDADFTLIEVLPSQRTPDVAPPVTIAPRVFFESATPGAANNLGVKEFLEPVELSVDRGFYDEAFELEITSSTQFVDIWYTTDGTYPAPDNATATLYDGPLTIDSTTAIRAAAYAEDATPAGVSTATYLFIDDILTQSPDGSPPAGFPESWGSNSEDYGMDPAIVNDPEWSAQLEDAFKQVPTMAVVMNTDDLFGAEGIYSHAGNRGREWERPASLELISPDGSEDGFQVDAGIRVRGGFSRSNSNPKHAFRFFFRQEYGPSKLNYPLFENYEDAVSVFDKIDLRTTQNYSWSFQGDSRNTFLRDKFSRDMQIAMGNNSTRGNYYHLYINGQYWGLFQTDERPSADFAASYDGGEPEDYDVVHNVNPNDQGSGRNLGAIDGTLDSSERLWNEFVKQGGLGDVNGDDYWRVQGMNPDGTRNLEYERMLDVDNLIDYMVITYYTSDSDGPGSKFTRPGLNNYFAYYNRENPDGWKFLEHDSEHSLDTSTGAGANGNMVTPLLSDNSQADDFIRFNPHWMHEQLANSNADYRQRFIDKVTDYFQDDGLWGDDNVIRVLDEMAGQIDLAMIAESARWGDAKRGTPFDLDDWENAVQTVKNWIPGRREDVLDQFRGVGWYPEFTEPTPTPETGTVNVGDTVTLDMSGNLEVEEKTFTTSAVIRTLLPTDGSLGTDWTNVGFSDSSWKFSTGDVGYEDGSGYEDLIKTEVPSGTTSVYIRPFIKFGFPDEDGDGDLTDEWDEMTLRVRYDDGFIAYLNGVEIARANAPADPVWNSVATQDHADASAVEYQDFPLDVTAMEALRTSGNVLSFHGLNTANSSDFLIGYRLEGQRVLGSDVFPGEIYYTVDGTDPRTNNGGAVSPSAILFDPDSPIPIDRNTVLNARAYLNDEWSALRQEFYHINLPSVTVSEINYNPYNPTDSELAAFPDLDNDDFEFVELINSGSESVSLAGLRFTDGFEANLPSIDLGPGERGVLVKNTAAYELRYGDSTNVIGTFSGGGLSNGGEQIVLSDGLDNVVFSMTYNDADPWPAAADGVGASLEFVGGATDSPSKYSSWRSSTDFGGSPGAVGSAPVGVVINEVLAHTDPPIAVSDSIELKNTTNGTIDIGGWFLSDAGSALRKYQIPAGTMLPAGGYIVFDESNFNPNPEMPGDNDFGLSGIEGDDVYLVIPDSDGGISQLVDDVHFIASPNGESFGRTPDGTGRLAPMTQLSLGATNSAPRIGPVVITEINYDPGTPSVAAIAADPDVVPDDLEFVELHNPAGRSVDLTDWRVRGGVDINFDDGAMLSSGETVVLVSFNPENPDNESRVNAFRAHYGIGEGVRLIGGYGGELSNRDERVQLQSVDEPPADDPTNVPNIVEDEVLYDSVTPWPSTGDGNSIQRRGPGLYGSVAASWIAESPTPGSVNYVGGVVGDFDGNGTVDATDIDLLVEAVVAGSNDLSFDLDENETIDSDDVTHLVEEVLGTFLGDANLDGIVDVRDLNVIGIGWQSNVVGWARGDFDGNGVIDASDLNDVGVNWQKGAEAARAPVAAVALPADVDSALSEADDRHNWLESTTEWTDQAAAKRRDGGMRRRWSASSERRRSIVQDVAVSHTGGVDADAIDDLFSKF